MCFKVTERTSEPTGSGKDKAEEFGESSKVKLLKVKDFKFLYQDYSDINSKSVTLRSSICLNLIKICLFLKVKTEVLEEAQEIQPEAQEIQPESAIPTIPVSLDTSNPLLESSSDDQVKNKFYFKNLLGI